MGQDPGAIREEIEATRAQMTQTADEIGERLNPRTQLHEHVDQAKQSLRVKATTAKDRATSARQRYAANPGLARDQAKAAAVRAQTTIRDNPRSTINIGVTTAVLAGGLIALVLRARHTRTQPQSIGDAVAWAADTGRSQLATLRERAGTSG